MSTDTTRRQYARAELLLPSDLTDVEWVILEQLPPPRSKLCRPPVWDTGRLSRRYSLGHRTILVIGAQCEVSGQPGEKPRHLYAFSALYLSDGILWERRDANIVRPHRVWVQLVR